MLDGLGEKFPGWPHIFESQQFSKMWIRDVLFPLAIDMETVVRNRGCNLLIGKRMVSFFYEPSTRTRCSFQMAMDYMGGTVPFATENAKEFSSVSKGETLEDTMNVLAQYAPDAIVMRHHNDKAAEAAVKVLMDFEKKYGTRIALINAGDGRWQHPTQALLDLFTIYKKYQQIDELSIAMVGDLANGRTVRSLSYLLSKFSGIEIHFVAPNGSEIGKDIKEYLHEKGVRYFESTDLREVAPKVNVIYQTRTQKERGGKIDQADHSIGYFTVDKTVMDLLRPQGIVMHPLPRNEEIAPDVDVDNRAVYLKDQVRAGLVIRMALLKCALAPAQ